MGRKSRNTKKSTDGSSGGEDYDEVASENYTVTSSSAGWGDEDALSYMLNFQPGK